MKKFSLLLLILFIISTVTSRHNFEFFLPKYQYHQFDNGFEVILVENHTIPLIAPVVVIKTGLQNETAKLQFKKLFFGSDHHNLSHPANGTPKSIGLIQLNDLK